MSALCPCTFPAHWRPWARGGFCCFPGIPSRLGFQSHELALTFLANMFIWCPPKARTVQRINWLAPLFSSWGLNLSRAFAGALARLLESHSAGPSGFQRYLVYNLQPYIHGCRLVNHFLLHLHHDPCATTLVSPSGDAGRVCGQNQRGPFVPPIEMRQSRTRWYFATFWLDGDAPRYTSRLF